MRCVDDDLESISDKGDGIEACAPLRTEDITPGPSSAAESTVQQPIISLPSETEEPVAPENVLPTPPASESAGRQSEVEFEILEEEPAIGVSDEEDPPNTVRKDGENVEEAYLEPHGLVPLTTPVNNHFMYIFFRFCAERHRMFNLRNEGVPRDQLTEDETMKKEHIGNVYRELDSGSLRMGDLIIPVGDQSNEEICCRSPCALAGDSLGQAHASPYLPLLRLLPAIDVAGPR